MSSIHSAVRLKTSPGLRTTNVWWLSAKAEKGISKSFPICILRVVLLVFYDVALILYFCTFRFGHVFMSETGTSVGEISGQSKPINSCDFRPSRPFRIVTGSEDNTVGVFEGPPFKFKMTKTVSCTNVLFIFYSLLISLTYSIVLTVRLYRIIQDSFRQCVSHQMEICLRRRVSTVKCFYMMVLVQILYLKLAVQHTKEEFME